MAKTKGSQRIGVSCHLVSETCHYIALNLRHGFCKQAIETNDKMGQDKIRFGNIFLFCKWVSTQTVHN